MFLGPMDTKYATLPEINGRELFTLVPLAVIVVVLGLFPSLVLNLMKCSMGELIGLIARATGS
jgi:NADH-quinone oxidoreductase subunit M